MAVIFGEEEVEVGSRVCNHSDFILFIDEVAAVRISRIQSVSFSGAHPSFSKSAG